MPDVQEPSEDSDFVATAAEDDRYAELLLAGFRACAREAIRFLLEEEGLSPDHPLPSGLNEHLVRQQCHLAGTLHNDSGVDFEESFLSCSPDGDTTSPRKRRCSEKETCTGESDEEDTGAVQTSEDDDTIPPRKRRCIERETHTGENGVEEDSGLVQTLEDGSISTATEEIVNCEKSETENVHRTEVQTSNLS